VALKTPLGRVLGLGSAKEGTEHFVGQRVSAIALALLGTWFAISMLGMESFAYLEVFRFVAEPFNTVLLVLLSAAIGYHSYLGVQVVIEDYVHGPAMKTTLLVASRFAHMLLAVAAVYAILRIGFTS
jgi:succinate dehydrogenase / fumarate reductase membrane anchor subunit